jgi:TPR repeat protein
VASRALTWLFVSMAMACSENAAPRNMAAAPHGAAPHATQSAPAARARTLEPRESDATLTTRCNAGDQKACVASADRLRLDPKASTQQREHAVLLYQTACDRKEHDGCAGLGAMYQEGMFVTRDVAHAVALYRAACDAGSGRGCSRLGALYARGEGVDRNVEHARGFLQTGCDRGDALGCINLGLMHAHGDGMPVDGRAAREQFRKACGLGDGAGCRELAGSYAQGLVSEPPSPQLAAMFSRQACALDDGPGCGNAGMNAQLGYGVPRDSLAASRLYKRACDLGEQRYCELLQRFAREAAAHGPAAGQ